MEVRTYKVTPETLDKLAERLRANGIALDPAQPIGQADAKGFAVSWMIGGGKIAVTMHKHPPLLAGVFWSHLQDALGSAVA